MKVILTGASGLLGHEIWKELARRQINSIGVYGNYAVESIDKKHQGIRSSVDLSDPTQVERLIFDEYPDVIINCAAFSSPDAVANNPELARKLNINLPERLAQLSHHLGAYFIHFSTDMVFDGQSETPYLGTDTPNPINQYGNQN